MRKIEVGKKYRHFKGDIMQVLYIAKHTESEELLVIYEHNNVIWARPYDMFNSLVDKNKYPEINQKYRFEEVN